jgi:predicted transcriptional regulator
MNLSWLNPTSIYFKLIASAMVLSIVAGAYFYVRHLNSEVNRLNNDNVTLVQSNTELKDTLKAQTKMQENIDKVSQAGDKQRVEFKKVRDKQLQQIDTGIRQGKDRAVGPILKEFFNE